MAETPKFEVRKDIADFAGRKRSDNPASWSRR